MREASDLLLLARSEAGCGSGCRARMLVRARVRSEKAFRVSAKREAATVWLQTLLLGQGVAALDCVHVISHVTGSLCHRAVPNRGDRLGSRD